MSHSNPTQAQVILDHLMEGWTLTALQALENYQCFRLAARIHELRKQGHPIEETIVTHNGKRYASYYIPTFKLQYA
jgi:Helix-turn-helix domain